MQLVKQIMILLIILMILSKVHMHTVVNGTVIVLPTALHADVDWNVHNKFYLNVNGDLGIVDKKELNQE
jgi:hypothetical protein